MNANEKRAVESAMAQACKYRMILGSADGTPAGRASVVARMIELDRIAAERRGEDRVLRRFMRYGYDIEVDEYRRERKARRARGVRRS